MFLYYVYCNSKGVVEAGRYTHVSTERHIILQDRGR